MIPTECPVSRAFTLYISLLISYITINTIKESTSYFPNNEFLRIKNVNYLEIQAEGLTPDLTPYDEIKAPLLPDLRVRVNSPVFVANSLTLNSKWSN
jgi:hypothetical protein